jgi:hypothetical protein
MLSAYATEVLIIKKGISSRVAMDGNAKNCGCLELTA